MQRTAAEQATPQRAPLPELPSELVVSIVRARKTGVVLVKMLRVCKAWRRALTAELASLWREVALARYPRLRAVLTIAQAQPPCFRSLYRSQLTADRSTYSLANQSPTLGAYVLTAELQVQDGAWTATGSRFKTIAHHSERMDYVVHETQEPLLYGRMMLTKEPEYDHVTAGWRETKKEFAHGRAKFMLYATRLSDLKTARIIESSAVVDDDYLANFDRYSDDVEGEKSGVVFGASYMERCRAMFEDQGSEPVVYATFAPSQMIFKFDFWEKAHGPNGDSEPIHGGTGPYHEMYMATEELRIYLRWHARWSD